MRSVYSWAQPLARGVMTVALSSSLMLGVLALSPTSSQAGTTKATTTTKTTPKASATTTVQTAAPAPQLPRNAVVVDGEALTLQLQAIEDQLVLIQRELDGQPALQKKVQRRIETAAQAISSISSQLQSAPPPMPAGGFVGVSAGPMGAGASAGAAVGPNGGMVSAGGMGGPMGGGVSAGIAVGPNGAVVSAGGMAGPMGGGVSGGVAVGPNGGMVSAGGMTGPAGGVVVGGVVNPPGPGSVVVVENNRPPAGGTRPAVVVVQASPPAGTAQPVPQPAPVEVRRAMDEGDLQSLLAAIDDEGFSQGKLQVLQTGAASHWFTVDQLKRIVGKMSFEQDKLQTVELIAPRLLDRENGYKLYGAFDFQSSKDKVAEILKR